MGWGTPTGVRNIGTSWKVIDDGPSLEAPDTTCQTKSTKDLWRVTHLYMFECHPAVRPHAHNEDCRAGKVLPYTRSKGQPKQQTNKLIHLHNELNVRFCHSPLIVTGCVSRSWKLLLLVITQAASAVSKSMPRREDSFETCSSIGHESRLLTKRRNDKNFDYSSILTGTELTLEVFPPYVTPQDIPIAHQFSQVVACLASYRSIPFKSRALSHSIASWAIQKHNVTVPSNITPFAMIGISLDIMEFLTSLLQVTDGRPGTLS